MRFMSEVFYLFQTFANCVSMYCTHFVMPNVTCLKKNTLCLINFKCFFTIYIFCYAITINNFTLFYHYRHINDFLYPYTVTRIVFFLLK